MYIRVVDLFERKGEGRVSQSVCRCVRECDREGGGRRRPPSSPSTTCTRVISSTGTQGVCKGEEARAVGAEGEERGHQPAL